MEIEMDGTFTYVGITLSVCIISGLLYYMFKHAALSPSRKTSVSLESLGSALQKKKNRKQDVKKVKKTKRRQSSTNEAFNAARVETDQNPEMDRSLTSDETIDEDESLGIKNDSPNDQDSQSCSSHKTELESELHAVAYPVPHAIAINATTGNLNTELMNEHPTTKQEPMICAAKHNLPESVYYEPLEEYRSVPHSNMVPPTVPSGKNVLCPAETKSKRSRRRAGKRSAPVEEGACPTQIEHVLMKPVDHVLITPRAVSDTWMKVSPANEPAINTESREEMEKLTDQLRVSEKKLEEVVARGGHLVKENDRLRQREEEHSLGLKVLQQQYTELLRANKSGEHEKHLIEVKATNLDAENKRLRSRMDQINADMVNTRSEAERETCKLRDQLIETQNKLATLSATPKPPPGPSAELVRATELAQLMSNENQRLQANLDQVTSDMAQLRQKNMLQQQEMQALHCKLRDTQDSKLEDLRAKFQMEKAEAASLIASYEAQLQRQCHELETQKQDLALNLKEAHNELAVRYERENRLTALISSMEYQFSELKVEKQRLLETADNSRAINESSTRELLVQVANLTNDLTRVTSDLHRAQQRADSVTAELEQVKEDHVTQLKQADPPMTEQHHCEVESASVQTTSSNTTASFVEPSSCEREQQLEQQIVTMNQQLDLVTSEVDSVQQLREAAELELEQHKSALVQTEGLLARLQEFVQNAESKWRTELDHSEHERQSLQEQLKLVKSKSKKVNGELDPSEKQTLTRRKQTKREKKIEQISPSPEGGDHADAVAPNPHSSSVASDEFTVRQINRVVERVNTEERARETASRHAQKVHASICIPKLRKRKTSNPTIHDDGIDSIQVDDRVTKWVPECNEVEGAWLELSPSHVPASRPEAGVIHVSARAVSGAHWSSAINQFQGSRPIGVDMDEDFDAVLVDDTDLNVHDDIWDSTSKASENLTTTDSA